jgi:anti-sigma regulatory factor (Ser/Thr protein kinase)
VRFARAAGADAEQLSDVRLACSEAITNVVRHAYRGERGLVHVDAALAGGELWVLVADGGCGLGVDSKHPGMGQGLRLIAAVSDELTIVERAEGGTELRMRFDLARAADVGHVRGSVASATAPAAPRFSTTQ